MEKKKKVLARDLLYLKLTIEDEEYEITLEEVCSCHKMTKDINYYSVKEDCPLCKGKGFILNTSGKNIFELLKLYGNKK